MSIDELFKSIESVTSDNAETEFANIAKSLLNNFYLKRGYVEFYFLEIEFYYYSEKHQDTVTENGIKRPFVYSRSCERNGQFLLHTSGVDICFKGKLNKDGKGEGGGILIRSLLMKKDNKEYLICGPWDCYTTLFSYTSNDINVQLLAKPKDNNFIERCKRKIADSKTKTYEMKDKAYAFYNPQYFRGNKLGLDRYDYLVDDIKNISYYPFFVKRKK
jgi:hypothetical protein